MESTMQRSSQTYRSEVLDMLIVEWALGEVAPPLEMPSLAFWLETGCSAIIQDCDHAM